MKTQTLLLIFSLIIMFPPELYAQSASKLTPYEQNRYGGALWDVPREPYESRYKSDTFKAKVYNLPESTVRERFQSQAEWENSQRDISERAAEGYRPPTQK